MNNTELTLDQLSDVSGGAAFIKLGDIKGEAYRQIICPESKTGLHDSVHCFRGRKTRNQTNFIMPTDGDDI